MIQFPYPGTIPGESNEAYEERIRWFQEARFGIFVHWGPAALVGQEISWCRSSRGTLTGGPEGCITNEVYDNLYRFFNPNKFNSDEWIDLFKKSGSKYLVFVAKHCDGFSLFDTQFSNYKITNSNSPFGKDICAEIADTCHRKEMPLFWYFSQIDFMRPEYGTKKHHEFHRYFLKQIRELCSNYGEIAGFWFDAVSHINLSKPDENIEAYNLIHELQPHSVSNDRLWHQGDFNTPEQYIYDKLPNRPMESCFSMCTTWSWSPNAEIKDATECIRILISCAGRDSNLLLNITPMPDGQIEPRQTKVLLQIGEWLGKYGDSIYKTKGGPFKPGKWGVSTFKDDRVYLHCINHGRIPVLLPPINQQIINYKLLTGGNVNLQQSDKGVEIHLKDIPDSIPASIIEVQLSGKAADLLIKEIEKKVLPGSLTIGKYSFSSVTFSEENGAANAIDDNWDTYWQGDANATEEKFLGVDLGKEVTVSRCISMVAGTCMRQFYIEFKDEKEEWNPIKIVNMQPYELTYDVTFPQVKARYWRLNLQRIWGPKVFEFHLFEK